MQLQDTADTTTLSYWLNWRVYLCALCVLLPMVVAFLVIWKHEGSRDSMHGKGKNQQDGNGTLPGDEAWKPCLKEIHPICLLAFRVIAFASLLATLIAKVSINGGTIFYYYTQVDFHFGYNLFCNVDQERNMPFMHHEVANLSRMEDHADTLVEMHRGSVTATLSCLFRVLFQMNAGAVMLTDCVYWFIIFPFLTLKDYDWNFMTVNMHTLNVILLLGDTALNCLQVPWTGMSFFVLWTGAFVIFQWIIHACVPIWWPYPFLDLSLPLAPLWYLLVGLLHIPCYGLFVLIVEMKHYFLSKWFPSSYQC
ncbi:uncharacterized protein LOC107605106 isoform X3 [Arachis ipaensis]|uniref:uncharacterized protein LOC107605106 isoform X3 n=1 Tax=Arachis ipaensis TaxID=130454 RepID=UPI000A2B4171|nr:uncharacterized protein LOC107605106 isoform X3 [Arachis ipaensis]